MPQFLPFLDICISHMQLHNNMFTLFEKIVAHMLLTVKYFNSKFKYLNIYIWGSFFCNFCCIGLYYIEGCIFIIQIFSSYISVSLRKDFIRNAMEVLSILTNWNPRMRRVLLLVQQRVNWVWSYPWGHQEV